MTRTQTVGKEGRSLRLLAPVALPASLRSRARIRSNLEKEPDWTKFREFLMKEVRYVAAEVLPGRG